MVDLNAPHGVTRHKILGKAAKVEEELRSATALRPLSNKALKLAAIKASKLRGARAK